MFIVSDFDGPWFNVEIRTPTGKNYCIGFRGVDLDEYPGKPKKWRYDHTNLYHDPTQPDIDPEEGKPVSKGEVEKNLKELGLSLTEVFLYGLRRAS